MKRARDIGGIDHEVHGVIGRLNRGSYDTLEQFRHDIRDIYFADGVGPDELLL